MMEVNAIKRVSVIGLGKLGSPLVAAMAHRGFEVVGIDLNTEFVEKLNRGIAPVDEPGLGEMIEKNRTRISATTEFSVIAETDATFFIVPTPSEPGGGFSVEYVVKAAESSGHAVKTKAAYHLFALTSTVMPGDTEKHLLPALERTSGKRCGDGFGLCYNPEFIALGSVIRDLLNPDFVLIGERDPRAGELLDEFYTRFTENNARRSRMSIVNAELTKLSVNTYVTTKISFANMLARICEGYPGADADVVSSALGLDTRIGRKYLKGAAAYGGPCFPRDNKAMAVVGGRAEIDAVLARATDQENRAHTLWLADKIESLLEKRGIAAVLGLAYKPDTNVAEEAQGVYLANELARRGLRVVAHDPKATAAAGKLLDAKVSLRGSLAEAVADADVVAITTPWKEYEAIGTAVEMKAGAALIDCWRMLPALAKKLGENYHAVGVGRRKES